MNRVLLIIDCLRAGGAQRQIVNLANGLAGKGYIIDLFIYYNNLHYKSELSREVNIITCYKNSRFSLKPLFRLRTLMRSSRYTAIVAYLETPSFYAEIAHLGISSTPLIISERSCFNKKKLLISILYQFHRLADKLVVNSFHQRENIVNCFPWISTKTVTIYNGIMVANDAVKNCGAPKSPLFRFIVISTVVPIKNAFNLAQAFALVHEGSHFNIIIDWAGEHSHNLESAGEFQKVNNFLKRKNICSHWNWLGVVKNVNQTLRNYNALIHPSLLEGVPNAVCEALASGIPVLAGKIGDHDFLVNQSGTGLLFNPEDPLDMAQAIRKFCCLPLNEKIFMGIRGKAVVETELNLDKMVSGYIGLFK